MELNHSTSFENQLMSFVHQCKSFVTKSEMTSFVMEQYKKLKDDIFQFLRQNFIPHSDNLVKELNSAEPTPVNENELVTHTEMNEFVTSWFQNLKDILSKFLLREAAVRPINQSPNLGNQIEQSNTNACSTHNPLEQAGSLRADNTDFDDEWHKNQPMTVYIKQEPSSPCSSNENLNTSVCRSEQTENSDTDPRLTHNPLEQAGSSRADNSDFDDEWQRNQPKTVYIQQEPSSPCSSNETNLNTSVCRSEQIENSDDNYSVNRLVSGSSTLLQEINNKTGFNHSDPEISEPTTSTHPNNIQTPIQMKTVSFFMKYGFTYEHAIKLLPFLENINSNSYYRQHWRTWYEWTKRPKNSHIHHLKCTPQQHLDYLKERFDMGLSPITVHGNWKGVLFVAKHSGEPYEAFEDPIITKFIKNIMKSEPYLLARKSDSQQEADLNHSDPEISQPSTSTHPNNIQTPIQMKTVSFFMKHGCTYEHAIKLLPFLENINNNSYYRQHWRTWYEWTKKPENSHIHHLKCTPQQHLDYLKERFDLGLSPITVHGNWRGVLFVAKHSGEPYEAFEDPIITKFIEDMKSGPNHVARKRDSQQETVTMQQLQKKIKIESCLSSDILTLLS